MEYQMLGIKGFQILGLKDVLNAGHKGSLKSCA